MGSNHAGRRSSVSGQRGQRPSFQNGLECAQAKSQETQRHQRARQMLQLKKWLKKTTKKQKRRRSRKFFSLCLTTSIQFDVTMNHSIRVIASIPSLMIAS